MVDVLDEAVPGSEGDRFRQFEEEINKLKIQSGRSPFERLVVRASLVGMIVGVVLAGVGWRLTRSAVNQLDIADHQALALFGGALTIACTGVYVVASLRRFLRYWIVRLIFEHRAQIDRLASGERTSP